ncbi:uncharacterized protein LOC117339194 [Pecten maximus]|uniref:uncharacterized protein LOC117339194 n=1 Tax=Pecten maximus TaxID=6579 RepID=UPI0014589409|nr:uncharacterized protein LOC117339194 [Pecten maximus]
MPPIKRRSTGATMAKKPSLRRDTTMTLTPSDESTPPTSVRSASSVRRSTSSKLSLKSSSSVTSLKRKTTLVSEGSGVYSSVVALESGSSIGKTGSLKAASVGKDCSVIPGTTSEAVATLRKSVSELKELKEATTSMKSSLSKRKSSLVKEPSLRKASLSKRQSSVPDVDPGTNSTTSPPLPPGGLLEIAISFDTTGSMYGCLEEVRGRIQDMVQRLQADIPGIRIAIIAHGDYCDAANYIVKWIDFGATVPELCDFVKTVSRTGGGDADECYELVLRRAREVLSWTPGSQRSLVVIGDCGPHEVGYRYGDFVNDINWRVEAQELKKMDVKIYSVCVNALPLPFYQYIANVTGGKVVSLAKFGVIFDILMSICYKESGSDLFEAYEAEVRERNTDKGMESTLDGIFTTLGTSAKSSPTGLFSPPLGTAIGTGIGSGPLSKPTLGRKTFMKAKSARKPAKTTGEKSKKTKARTKSGGRLTRESLTDAKFTKGPLNRLVWSKWMLGIAKTQSAAIGPDISLTRREWCDAYCNNGILKAEEVKDVPAVYEFAVRLSGKKKVYPVLYKVTTGRTKRQQLVQLSPLSKKGTQRHQGSREFSC